MRLLPDDPRRLLIAGDLLVLIAVLLRVRSQRQARRRRVAIDRTRLVRRLGVLEVLAALFAP